MLRLHAGVVRVRALRRVARAWLADQTGVLVVAHGLLREAAEDFVLLVPELGDPAAHVVEHLALDLRVVVVKVWVEARGLI